MHFETFEAIFHEALEEFPDRYLHGLSGVFCRREAKSDPAVPGMLRLGEYIREPQGLGDHVILYYGSFLRVYGPLPREEMKKRVFDTIGHEILHHLEHRAGIDDLGDEDRRYLEEAKRRAGLSRAGARELRLEAARAAILILSIILLVFLLSRAGAP